MAWIPNIESQPAWRASAVPEARNEQRGGVLCRMTAPVPEFSVKPFTLVKRSFGRSGYWTLRVEGKHSVVRMASIIE
jgi:hypothetical protein